MLADLGPFVAWAQRMESTHSVFFPQGIPNPTRPRRLATSTARPSPATVPDESWFWGLGRSLANLRESIEVAAGRDLNILIIGETGTGKEFIASHLHQKRRARLGLVEELTPFVSVNCGALPENLTESILFGHERGAFTSARERQYGKFELSRRGTLFLDEIQTLPVATQVKFLRVLQSREMERLGAKDSTTVECQIVAATNIPLELMVRERKFRRDLYYRLNICPLYIPALRQRREDLPTLIKGMFARVRRAHRLPDLELSPEAFERLLVYDWPGNLRELEHTLLYAGLRANKVIRTKDLPAVLTGQLEQYLENGLWDL